MKQIFLSEKNLPRNLRPGFVRNHSIYLQISYFTEKIILGFDEHF